MAGDVFVLNGINQFIHVGVHSPAPGCAILPRGMGVPGWIARRQTNLFIRLPNTQVDRSSRVFSQLTPLQPSIFGFNGVPVNHRRSWLSIGGSNQRVTTGKAIAPK